jgi:glycosyltransferase involved in cell wall biosynthesis
MNGTKDPGNPLVSYCIPAYNHARYVEACLDSILAQSYPHIEVVVIDDCSTDSTYEIIRTFNDPRVRAQRNPINVGPGETVNRCMRMACGEFIAFSGSDDVHLRDKTAIQVEHLLANPQVDAVFCTPDFIGPQGEPLSRSKHPDLPVFPAFNANRVVMFQELLRRGNFLLAPSVIVRRSVVDRVGFFDPGLIQLQDYDYWLRIVVGGDLLILDQPLIQYRMLLNGSNLSSENDASKNRHHFELSIVLEKLAAPLNAGENIQQVQARRALMLQVLEHIHSRDAMNFKARLLYGQIAGGVDENNSDVMEVYRKFISDNAIFSDRNPLVDFSAKLLRYAQKTIGRTT